MTLNLRACWLLTCVLSLASTGCMCTQGLTTCSSSSCDVGPCATGPLGGLGSCRSGCGEVYIDEWLNTPPCIDDCGYGNCGSCDSCGTGGRRPLMSFARALLGIPGQILCGGCEAGCSSCSGGEVHSSFAGSSSSCNCGGSHPTIHHSTGHGHSSSMHSGPVYSAPAPSMKSDSPAAPTPAPEAVPTPAPVEPSSAKRLNPAQQRAKVSRASATR